MSGGAGPGALRGLREAGGGLRGPGGGSERPCVPAGYVTTILEDAKVYSSHAKKPSVDAEDVRLAIQCRTDQSFTSPPPRDVSAAGGQGAGPGGRPGAHRPARSSS